MTYQLVNFYRFVPIAPTDIEPLKEALHQLAREHALLGLVLLAPEGVNATVAGSATSVAAFKGWLEADQRFRGMVFKEGVSHRAPFRRFKVDCRPEIVTFDYPVASEEALSASLMSPKEWDAKLRAKAEGRDDFLLIDVRNRYETALGKFRGAIDPDIQVFTDLPGYLEREKIPTDREILMYCTGGIRCEKALQYMHDRGYAKTRQLAGGILRYLEECPNEQFEGECFVFDHRVAVDQNLAPSQRYHLCVHCGDPGQEILACKNCGATAKVCAECAREEQNRSCSKNCAYHLARKRA